MQIYIARLETRNWEFAGYGNTPDEARDLLRKKFLKTMSDRFATLTWSEASADLWIEEVTIGTATVR
jgi:hypothetical protein